LGPGGAPLMAQRMENQEVLPDTTFILQGCQKSGYLDKRGMTTFNKAWKQHFLVLKDGVLYYLKTKKDPRPTGMIKLSVSSTTLTLEDGVLEIVEGIASHSFRASSEAEDLDSWFATLKKAKETFKEETKEDTGETTKKKISGISYNPNAALMANMAAVAKDKAEGIKRGEDFETALAQNLQQKADREREEKERLEREIVALQEQMLQRESVVTKNNEEKAERDAALAAERERLKKLEIEREKQKEKEKEARIEALKHRIAEEQRLAKERQEKEAKERKEQEDRDKEEKAERDAAAANTTVTSSPRTSSTPISREVPNLSLGPSSPRANPKHGGKIDELKLAQALTSSSTMTGGVVDEKKRKEAMELLKKRSFIHKIQTWQG